eukprot:TRINITY_DN2676_c0_g1_i4.p1 TRINITY_DN2676_c0_g1~~TRINITY_DN2676_c0_g1_i4.p1  ORF type:complete len:185 (+),score=25.62 TRINITY_DN2676_c0_g1_i4:853-1407(+)
MRHGYLCAIVKFQRSFSCRYDCCRAHFGTRPSYYDSSNVDQPNCKLVKSCPSAMKKENMGKALERIAKDHPNPIFVFQGTEARSDEATRQIGRYAATAAAAQELSAPAETKKSATVDGQEGKLDAMVQKHRDVMRKMIEDHTLALREHERKRSELEEAHASIVRERDEYRAKYEALVALQGQEQ